MSATTRADSTPPKVKEAKVIKTFRGHHDAVQTYPSAALIWRETPDYPEISLSLTSSPVFVGIRVPKNWSSEELPKYASVDQANTNYIIIGGVSYSDAYERAMYLRYLNGLDDGAEHFDLMQTREEFVRAPRAGRRAFGFSRGYHHRPGPWIGRRRWRPYNYPLMYVADDEEEDPYCRWPYQCDGLTWRLADGTESMLAGDIQLVTPLTQALMNPHITGMMSSSEKNGLRRMLAKVDNRLPHEINVNGPYGIPEGFQTPESQLPALVRYEYDGTGEGGSIFGRSASSEAFRTGYFESAGSVLPSLLRYESDGTEQFESAGSALPGLLNYESNGTEGGVDGARVGSAHAVDFERFTEESDPRFLANSMKISYPLDSEINYISTVGGNRAQSQNYGYFPGDLYGGR